MPLRATTTHPIPISPAPPPSRRGGLELNRIPQDDVVWCWAACVEMILKHFEVSVERQCQIARKGLLFRGLSISCCTSQNTSNGDIRCDITLVNSEITRLWENFSIRAEFKPRRLNPNIDDLVSELKDLLSAKHPIELKYDSSPTGHVVILYGWELDSAGQLNFLFHDPQNEINMAVDADEITRPGLGVLSATWTISDPG